MSKVPNKGGMYDVKLVLMHLQINNEALYIKPLAWCSDYAWYLHWIRSKHLGLKGGNNSYQTRITKKNATVAWNGKEVYEVTCKQIRIDSNKVSDAFLLSLVACSDDKFGKVPSLNIDPEFGKQPMVTKTGI